MTYYCLLGIAQNVGWSQISSAADASKQLFGRETTDAQLEALLSWGPWGYFAGAPIAIGMLHNPKQPRLAVNKCVAVAAILTLLG